MTTYNYKIDGIAGLMLDMVLRRQIGRAFNIPMGRIKEGHPVYFTNGTIAAYEGHDLNIIADDLAKAEATKARLYNLTSALKIAKK